MNDDMNIDFSKLPAPLPADASEDEVLRSMQTFKPTPQNQPVVNDLGKEFDMSNLPAPLPAEEEPQRGMLADAGVALAHGVESAARETVRTAGTILSHTSLPQGVKDVITGATDSQGETLTPKPETTLGKITSDLVRFGLGFVAGGTIIKGVGVAANIGKSAVGTGIVADPHAERLANIIEQYPSLQNPITSYLSANETDSIAEGKFKAALEDSLTNPIAQLAFKSIKYAKGLFNGKTDEATKASLAEDLLKVHHPTTTADDVIDPAVQAERARQAITPAWNPLKLSDEKALAFKEEVDKLLQSKDASTIPTPDGIINTKHLESGPEVLNSIKKLGAMIEPEMRAAGWSAEQTHGETKALADAMLMEADSLKGGLQAAGVAAEQMPATITAGRMQLQAMASNIVNASKKAMMTGEGKEQVLKAVQDYIGVMSSFKTIQTGVGRSLESFKIKVGPASVDDTLKALNGKDGDELLKIFAASEGDPEVISRLAVAAEASVGRKILDSHNELWINALLSGPRTHMVNIASTSVNMLMQPLNLVVGGSLRRDWADVREGVALYRGILQHTGDAFTMARKALAQDKAFLSPKGTNEIGPAITPVNYGLDPESIIGNAVHYLGKTVRLSTRFLGAEDELFKQLSYRSKLSAQISREATDLMKAGKLTSADRAAWEADKFKAGIDEQTGAALDTAALKHAEKVTFTSDLKVDTWKWMGERSFGESLQGIASTHPILRGTVLPFVRVPANLARQATDYGPLAVVRKQFWSDIEAGGSRRSEAIGKASLGSVAWISAGLMASNGVITGAAPHDKELRAQLEATGWRPYSIKIGDTYQSFNRLDPFAAVLGIVADFVQISGHLPEKDRDNIAEIMTLSLVNNFASKSYLKGLIDTLSIVGSNEPRKMEQWFRQRTVSYVPSLFGALNPDRELKDVRSVLDAAMTKIPGFSASVEAKRDLFGQKRMQDGTFPFSAFNPFPSSTEKADPVAKELARLAMGESQAQWATPPALIGNVDLRDWKTASGQSALDRYHELIGTVKDAGGRDMHQAFLDRINSHSYQSGNDGDSWYAVGSRVSMLRTVHDQYKQRALQTLQRELPALADALRKDKQNRLAMKHNRERANPLEVLRQFGE